LHASRSAAVCFSIAADGAHGVRGETATTGFRFISGKKHAPSALKSKRETLRLLPDRYRI
jgi:hypothetical protein